MVQKKKMILIVNGHEVEAFGKISQELDIYIAYENSRGEVGEWVGLGGFSTWAAVEKWLERLEKTNNISVYEVSGV